MDLKQTSTWRSRTGKIGTVVCLLLFLAILDALIARFREPLNHFSGLPGKIIAVTAPLTDPSDDLRDLSYISSSQGVRLHFEALQKGYWFGGAMWNGTLDIGPDVLPGNYTVQVKSKRGAGGNSGSPFFIKVYKDLAELKKGSTSLFLSLLGINPWPVALCLFPLVLLSFGLVFYLSGLRDRLLFQEGKAEVYRVRSEENDEEIFFALGNKQGVRPGTRLILSNPQGSEIGSIITVQVFENHSTARVDKDWKVHPGFMVSQ
jgi:hypothetical protein